MSNLGDGVTTERKAAKGVWRRARWALLAVLAVLLLLKTFVIDRYTVPQAGMFPTIPSGGSFFAWKHPYRDPSQVRRGDVIAFWRQLPDGQKYQFVWRVVGLPGDRIELAGDSVSVNGQPLPREQARTENGLVIYREHNGDAAYEVAYPSSVTAATSQPVVTLTVPPDQFFVLGDNRDFAQDSRYDGTVPFTHIVAKKL
ncbi:MAG TPA: signal peptidase I [Tepidisphaeraceae bacterium]|nr:signal peptidase I [Tepidisphaeraceae bacterium]